MELDFTNCRNKADVEMVFNIQERELEKQIGDLGKLRLIFLEEDDTK